MRSFLVVIGCGGCVSGGGPTVGYGFKSGLFVGGEVGVGLLVPEGVIGYQSSSHTVYGRVDANFNDVDNPGTDGIGARFGGGLGISLADEDRHVHGMFVGGVTASTLVGKRGACDGVQPSQLGEHDGVVEIECIQVIHDD